MIVVFLLHFSLIILSLCRLTTYLNTHCYVNTRFFAEALQLHKDKIALAQQGSDSDNNKPRTMEHNFKDATTGGMAATFLEYLYREDVGFSSR